MIVKLLTEQHLVILSFKGGCTGSSESTHTKIPHCWKSHVAAHLCTQNIPFKVAVVVFRLTIAFNKFSVLSQPSVILYCS